MIHPDLTNTDKNQYELMFCVQVAIIAGNFDLAEIIKIHKTSDVGEFKRI